MRAIVLAAGTGSRLGEITRTRTKGMVPVCGRKLIDYLLDFLRSDCFEEIIVVGGFHYEDLKDFVEGRKLENVRIIRNEDYLKGNIFTLIRGLREFSGDSFLITNVDHVYPSVMFDTMRKSFSSITAMCDFDRTLSDDDMKVKLKEGNRIELISKKLADYNCGYIGMTFVDASMESVYLKAVDKTLEKFGEKAVVENILQILAEDDNTAPQICDLSGFGWYEVDTEEDLIHAEKGILNNPNF